MAEQQVEGQRNWEKRQPDGHGLLPAWRFLHRVGAEPVVDTAYARLFGAFEQAVAAL